MDNIRKHIITDEGNRPVAVQIDYEDWCKIEQVLNRGATDKRPTNLSRHLGKLDWPVDGMDYQRQVRSEWN